ncbi:MAG: hypothetical protein JXR88_09290 [Clostridia bacterium]|nr:hypothetical protein [Clostridia bacterium]
MNKLMTISFMALITVILLLGIVLPDDAISYSERRPLAKKPEWTWDAVMSGEYFDDLEKYFLDHMPFREKFKALKVAIELEVFHKSDINDLYLFNEHLIKIEYPYHQNMGLKFVNYIESIEDLYLKDNKVFVAIIPDKNYFGPNTSLKLDYEQLFNDVQSGDYEYIDLVGSLNLEDYYFTDPHWKQENLQAVLNTLSKAMGFDKTISFSDYEVRTFENFYGAYAGQSSIDLPSESLSYLYHDDLKDLTVFNYENNAFISLYDEIAFEGIDPYDVFVGGASPLIEIVNENATSDKELIIFRDSFSSALAPLLADAYSKITLVDTRYITHTYLENFIDFKDQDVLFLYSTLVVNNSVMLK